MSNLYDIIIIGGGINGCALARHASRAGFHVALLEKDDFGAGVTSRSTRLIHGGLRYLESFQFKVVRESLHDRRAWLDEYPGLVRPQPFLIPVYRNDSRPPWYIHIGLSMYGWLSRDPELGVTQRLGLGDVELSEPGLDREGLRAAFRYFDCQAVYPEKSALAMALQAEAAGATVRNHTPVTGFLRRGERIVGVRSGDEEFESKIVVSAAGPWVDQVRGMANGAGGDLITRLNGAHIVVRPFEGAPQNAVYHEARSDKRPFFIIPWRRLYLIGTTETPFEGDPDRVIPTEPEIEYLLNETRLLFPGSKLERSDVRYAYEGSRPLLRAEGNFNKASRDHTVYDHEAEDGVAGMLSMVGGKLTTARSFARDALAVAAAKLGKPDPGALAIEPGRTYTKDERLAELYGADAFEIDLMRAADPDRMEKPAAPGAPATTAEVLFAVDRQKAVTLGDILLRRTGLAYEADFDPDWPREIAHLVAKRLQWDGSAIEKQVADFQAEIARTLVRI